MRVIELDAFHDRLRAEAEARNSHGEWTRTAASSTARAPAAARRPVAAAPAPAGEASGAAVWGSDEGTASLSPASKDSIARIWYGPAFQSTQNNLRSPGRSQYNAKGRLMSPAEEKQFSADVRAFTAAIRSAKPFQRPVVLHRGVDSARMVFGPPGSATGKIIEDKGFVSATSNTDVAKDYTVGLGGGNRALVNMHVPAGTRALKVDPDTWSRSVRKVGQTPPDVLQEYTLPPGTRLRVNSDTVNAAGARIIDVTVLS